MTRAATVADVVADAIAGRAADRAFAYPGGGSNLELIDALARRGVELVLARSEGGAAMMAAAYADLAGRPATVLVGLGPGVANVVNGVAHARLDQSALLVISDRFAAAELGTTGHQVLDQVALLAPVAKWQATLAPAGAAATMERALELAAAAPCGPVHLELPRDVVLEPARDGDGAPTAAEAERSPADAGAPARAAGILLEAARPLVLVGDEALDVPQRDLVALAERLSAPVLTTYKGKGAFPELHPLWCGILTNAALESALLHEADALLAVGVDPVELLPRPWTVSAPVVALRAHAEDALGYGPVVALVGDPPALVAALAERLGEGASLWTAGAVTEARESMLAALRVPSAGPTALEIVEAAQSATPADATVAVDAGAHMFAATWGWRATLPRRFLISNGLATMGFAVPAAVAAALARPGEPVIAFSGDGGFLLHGAELETAVRTGARLVVVVLNDSSLSLIRIKQQERRYRREAVDFGRVDAAGFARALGAGGVVADTPGGVRAAVSRAFGGPGPVVIDVPISGGEYGDLQQVIRTVGATSERKARPCPS